MGTKVEVLARGWKLEVDPLAGVAYTEVLGLTGLTFGREKKDAPTTDFADAGNESHLVAARSKTISIEANFLEDNVGVRDPGQAAMETLGDAIGSTSIGRFKLTSPSGWVKEFYGSVKIADIGGGVDEITKWGAEITRSGADIS